MASGGPARAHQGRPRYRGAVLWSLQAAVVSLAYFGAAKLGLSFASINASASPVWPPAGLALAAIVLLGYRMAPAVFVGAFAANATTAGTVASSLAIAAGNAGAAVVGAWAVLRFANGRRFLRHLRDAIRFVVLGGLAAPVIAATVGVSALVAAGAVPTQAFWPVWGTWWLGDAVGVIVVAPLVVALANWKPPQSRADWSDAVRELILPLFSAVIVGAIIFGEYIPSTGLQAPLAFLVLPLVAWAATRGGPLGAATATAAVTVLAVWGTVHGNGPFAGRTPNETFLLLGIFMAVVGTTAMALAAETVTRHRAERAIHAALERSENEVRRRTRNLEQALDQLAGNEQLLSHAERTMGLGSWTWEAASGTFAITENLRTTLRTKGLGPRNLATLAAHLHEEDRDQFLRAVRHVATGRNVAPLELRLADADSEGLRWVQMRLQRIEAGRTARPAVVGTVLDVTDRIRTSEELERSREQLALSERLMALGTLVSGVAHEVRTPLTYIQTNVALMRMAVAKRGDEALVAEVSRRADRAREGVRRIERIVRQLRLVAKPELRQERVGLHVVLADALELFGATRRGEVEVQHDIEPTRPTPVDPGQIEQVFLNLLTNAAEAMEGEGHIQIRGKRVSGGYRVTIQDDGPGMNEEAQRRLFEPFYTSKREGTGLGMAVSRRIVEAHGGRINFASVAGEGTTFTIFLPDERPEPDEADSTEADDNPLSRALREIQRTEEDLSAVPSAFGSAGSGPREPSSGAGIDEASPVVGSDGERSRAP